MRAGPAFKTLLRWLGAASFLFLSLATSLSSTLVPPHTRSVIIVVGAPGESDYEERFTQWANQWKTAAEKGGAHTTLIGVGPTNAIPDLGLVQNALKSETNELSAELWLVLIGHGTFDGKTARFNLRGPDFTAADLAEYLQPIRRPLAIINSSSASAPFLNALSATGRVIITATRSGGEHNYTRFGGYLSEVIADPTADLDKDGQTSLLEAFLSASRQVAEFYELEGRLATEHSLLDDNGDGLGTPPDWFRGVRAIKKAKDNAIPDGFRAHQFHLLLSDAEQKLDPQIRAKRDTLELELVRLRDRKSTFEVDEYYRQLEAVLTQLARLYEDGAKPKPDKTDED